MISGKTVFAEIPPKSENVFLNLEVPILCLLLSIPVMAQNTPLEPVKTSITVVEKISTEAPASISVLDRQEIRGTPGVNLDDRLREVPGFTLFRRSSSLVAHPTTQGVSLRGIGPTGASRTLVLRDGIPVNDPFGGWVYWTRFSPDELERVEISRGASTSIFGNRAMGGVIHLFSRQPEPVHLQASYAGGNRNSHEVSAGFSHLASRWAVSAHGRAFTTDGYFIVPENVRGAVDQRASVDFVAADSRLDFLGSRNNLFLKLDLLAEERHNGTVLQRNSTGLGSAAVHYVRERHSDSISLLGYHTREQFHSTFSAISEDRNSERLTVRQTVPSEEIGAGALWNHRKTRWNSLVGADVTRQEGQSIDNILPAGRRLGGGALLQHGVFAETHFSSGALDLFAGARHDFTGQDRQFFSPSGGLAVGRRWFRARGSVYRSFRAPTLNELFREFRAGNVVTQANDSLRPERLFGAEAGLDLVGESTRASLTLFRNALSDLITNVTLSTTPNLILRQRQNAASVLDRGAECNVRRRVRNWTGEVAYLFVDSRFSNGQRIPQVPRHQGSARLSYQHGGTLAAAGIRSFSFQFEDERNQFLLPGYATVQLVVQQHLSGNLSARLAFENLLDRQYLVGFTPTPAAGGPRLWRAGLSWEGRLR